MSESEIQKELKSIKERFESSAEIEGDEYKWMAMRNEDIEFLFWLART